MLDNFVSKKEFECVYQQIKIYSGTCWDFKRYQTKKQISLMKLHCVAVRSSSLRVSGVKGPFPLLRLQPVLTIWYSLRLWRWHTQLSSHLTSICLLSLWLRRKVWSSMRSWGTWRRSVSATFPPSWLGRYQEVNWGTCFLIAWTQSSSSTSEEVGGFQLLCLVL